MAAGDVTILWEDTYGTRSVRGGTIELPSSYVAGGVALTTAKFGLASGVDHVDFEPVVQDADESMIARYDRANDKVQVFQAVNAADALQEVAAGVNLSTFTCRFKAEGRK